MAFSWSIINKYDKLKYHTLTELRENADYLSDNAANYTYDSAEDGAEYTGDNSTYRSSFLNDNHISDYSGQVTGRDSTYDPGQWAHNSGVNSSVASDRRLKRDIKYL